MLLVALMSLSGCVRRPSGVVLRELSTGGKLDGRRVRLVMPARDAGERRAFTIRVSHATFPHVEGIVLREEAEVDGWWIDVVHPYTSSVPQTFDLRSADDVEILPRAAWSVAGAALVMGVFVVAGSIGLCLSSPGPKGPG